MDLKQEYEISTEQSRLDVNLIHGFLQSSYWAKNVPRSVVERSIQGSLCFGAFHGDQRVGFARVMTDFDRRDTAEGRRFIERMRILAMKLKGSRLAVMNKPVDIDSIKGRQRAEDLRRLRAGEVTPEELDRENSLIRSAADIVYTDFSPKGTAESWKRILQEIKQS